MKWRPISLAIAFAVLAQSTMAQDSVEVIEPPAGGADAVASSPCGSQPITIAQMQWPSAEVLAAIHTRLLVQNFGCIVRQVPGDLGATGSAMGSTGQPAIAPEMWTARIADIWNAGLKTQKVRSAAPAFTTDVFEGWFIPDYTASAHPELAKASDLAAQISALAVEGAKPRFISCPADWACSIVNRNLLRALGLDGQFDIVEPANRFEMDKLIAEAVSHKEPFLFYYWQPNPVLSQFGFKAIDLGAYDHDAYVCLGRRACPDPKPSGFAPDPVVVAVADWVFTDAPEVAAYFQHASVPLPIMNQLLARLSEPNATPDSVAEQFVAEQPTLWRAWVAAGAPAAP